MNLLLLMMMMLLWLFCWWCCSWGLWLLQIATFLQRYFPQNVAQRSAGKWSKLTTSAVKGAESEVTFIVIWQNPRHLSSHPEDLQDQKFGVLPKNTLWKMWRNVSSKFQWLFSVFRGTELGPQGKAHRKAKPKQEMGPIPNPRFAEKTFG